MDTDARATPSQIDAHATTNGPERQELVPMSTAREWLTVVEAADELSVSEGTIRRWITEGVLPAWRPSKRTTRIPRAGLESIARATTAIEPDRTPRN